MVHSPLCPSQINVTTVREHLPKGDFSIMTEMLKKFLSFMNLTVSTIGKTHLLSAMLHDGTDTVITDVTNVFVVILNTKNTDTRGAFNQLKILIMSQSYGKLY